MSEDFLWSPVRGTPIKPLLAFEQKQLLGEDIPCWCSRMKSFRVFFKSLLMMMKCQSKVDALTLPVLIWPLPAAEQNMCMWSQAPFSASFLNLLLPLLPLLHHLIYLQLLWVWAVHMMVVGMKGLLYHCVIPQCLCMMGGGVVENVILWQ